MSSLDPNSATLNAQDTGNELVLRDDLARLCLPSEYRDSNRILAWTNSICALFLAIGAVGLKSPRVHVREIAKAEDVVPVIFNQPEEPQPAPPEQKQDEPPPASPLEDTPVVATVVAINSPAVAFAVPVKGPVILAPARFADPAPAKSSGDQAVRRATRFNPTAGDRSTPQPEYPRLALMRGYEGKVTVNFTVEPSGTVTKVELAQSSGFSVLDEAALGTIRNRWRFAPGELRYHYVEIVFQLK
ncbi:MAG: hypothetical protein RLY20_2019 [Verrucomicrobiota bacterium]|jgi:protein TonB